MLSKITTWGGRKRIIYDQAKKEGNIIHGSGALKEQMGIFARTPADVDIFTTNPKVSARNTETSLNKASGGDNYYIKPSKHPGTFKVKHKGFDGIKGTYDDKTVADFTKTPKEVKTKEIRGILFRTVDDINMSKEKTVKNQEFSHRHSKDMEDIKRIKNYKKIGRLI